MKINKIMSIILLILPAFMMQSCYKDDEEVFEKNSANRMSEYLAKAKEVLTSGNSTWMMEMYPESAQCYGGWAFTLQFTNDDVKVRSELFKSTDEVTSLWTLTNDDGPVLTFDTYNEILHYFSTPDGNSTAAFPNTASYVAFEGEFGWIIMDVQQDVIRLRGKKTGNTVYMYRMTEDPKDYLDKLADVEDAMVFTGLQYVNGNDTVNGVIDVDNRQLIFDIDGEDKSVAYAVTPTGIRFYKDVEIGGTTVRDLTLKMDGATPVSMDTPDNKMSFAATYPEGWSSYADFEGDFKFVVQVSSKATAGYDSIPVHLTPCGDGLSYWLSGLNEGFDVKMKYDKPTGTLQMLGQILTQSTDRTAPYVVNVSGKDYYAGMISFALPVNASSGSVSYGTTIGLKASATSEPGVYKISDNGKWAGYQVTCMRIYCFSSQTMSSSSRQSSVTVPNEARFFVNDAYSTTLYYPKSLVKVGQ